MLKRWKMQCGRSATQTIKTQPSAGRNAGRGLIFLLLFKLNIGGRQPFGLRRAAGRIWEKCPKRHLNFVVLPRITWQRILHLPLTTSPISRTIRVQKKKTPCGVGKDGNPFATHLCDHQPITQTLYTECLVFVLTIARLDTESQAYRFFTKERGLAFLFVPCACTLKNQLPRAI